MKRALLLAACGAAACSAASIATEPNVAGVYAVTLVDGANDCVLPGWTQSQTTPGVQLSFSQDPTNNANISAVLAGDAGAYLAALTGTTQMCGILGGYQASLATGSCPDAGSLDAALRSDGCTYGLTATLNASFQSNTVQGTLSYGVSSTNGTACGALGGCQSVQAFAGVIVPADGGSQTAEGSPDAGPDATSDATRPPG